MTFLSGVIGNDAYRQNVYSTPELRVQTFESIPNTPGIDFTNTRTSVWDGPSNFDG